MATYKIWDRKTISQSFGEWKLVNVPSVPGFSEHTGGYTPAEATRVAGTMLPDVLHYNPKRPAVYPENGRTLTGDVVDFFLPLLSNGKVTKDNVGPHKDLLTQFPYVGTPH